MKSHWNIHLEDKLPFVKGRPPLMLNPYFQEIYEECARNIVLREGKYENKYMQKLLKKVEKHINLHKSKEKIIPENILFLVHPFYMQLSDFHFINEKTKKESNEYLEKISNFLIKEKNKKLKTIVVETAHHYTSVTSSLLEQNLIDDIILSKYDCGTPFDKVSNIEAVKSFLKEINSKNIFIGGSYNKLCLSTFITYLHKFNINPTDLNYLNELILNAPKDTAKTLKPELIYVNKEVWIPKEKTKFVNLEKLYELIKN